MMPTMRRWSGGDVLAGLAVAGLILPEGVAYAGIAGLAPAQAVIAVIAGGLAYALIGQSRFAIVAPTSSSAAILAAALATMGGGAVGRDVFAVVLVALVGLIFLAAALLRLGGLSAFISRPVLKGFAFGLALTIVVRQLPRLFGLTEIAPGNVFEQAWHIAQRLGEVDRPSAILGLSALMLLALLKRWLRGPATLLVLIGGIALSAALRLGDVGIALAGSMTLTLPHPQVPPLGGAQWAAAAQLAAPIALILFAESWGAIRALSLRHGDEVRAGRELFALGASNLAAAALGGMPVGAGFSAAAASEAAGARSRLTGLTAALAVLALALFASGWIALIPEPVLAAIVIAALAHALSLEPFRRLARIGRDRWIAVAAALGVLALGVLNGMLAAVALSLVSLLRGYANPTLSTLGQIGADGHDYVDADVHASARRIAGIGIYRPNAPLFFANAEPTLTEIAERAATDKAGVVILSLEQSSDLDSTAAEALVEFVHSQKRRHRPVVFARLHDAARAVIAASGLTADAEEGTFSVAGAVDQALTMVHPTPPA